MWEPFARNNQIDRTNTNGAYRIGQADLRDVREADGLFAVVNGCPRKVKIFSRLTSLYCATSCNRHGKQKSALVEPQCFPPLRLST